MMAVGEAPTQVKITLLLSCVWVILFLSGCLQFGHSQYHSPPEVVIPLKVTGTSRSMRPPSWTSYSLTFGGQRHIVHMKAKKLLVSRHFSVFTYSDQGVLLEDKPFVPSDCYFHGYVEGNVDSLVTLSTCFGGFQGRLRINDTAYEIKPKRFSVAFEHLLYKMDSEDTESPPKRCGLADEEMQEQVDYEEVEKSLPMKRQKWSFYNHQFYIELGFVIDYDRFVYRERNISLLQIDILKAIHLADGILIPFKYHPVANGFEVWTTGNLVSGSDVTGMLHAFCRWTRQNNFGRRLPHDIATIVIRQHNICDNYVCTTTWRSMCYNGYSCAVDCYMDENAYKFGIRMVHEQCHIVGVRHDTPQCVCPKSKCIMNPRAEPADVFSNCSFDMMYQKSMSPLSSCLRAVQSIEKINLWKTCGNGVIDSGEVCDCGSIKLCESDPCCTQQCTLEPSAVCAFGLCCKDCQFMAAGTMCREQHTECDLPEWCNGTSGECPEDVYVEDGLPCLGKGFCYEKRCNIRDDQCRKIFGSGAKNANPSCYSELNTKGERFGHCGLGQQSYHRCNITNSPCGRLQCENVKTLPSLSDHTTVFSIAVNGVLCWATDYHFGMTIYDIGRVTDGTECGEGHMCVNAECVRVPEWEDACSPGFCHQRGICNNKHHCHCNYGFSPPDCLENGTGGSTDSGPAPRRIKVQARREKNSSMWILMFLIFCFLLLIILMLVLLVVQKSKSKPTPATKQEDKTSQTLLVEENEKTLNVSVKNKTIPSTPVKSETNVVTAEAPENTETNVGTAEVPENTETNVTAEAPENTGSAEAPENTETNVGTEVDPAELDI